ncbi:APC family permease [Geodermatophilus sabuli]|uniref:Amino acid transporter n=1 Tax=Geodermatophilus sabuli TaxID=1564158 RepID=A0A285EDF5_9ACTN|nr:APC family permease [Geodermatophilus sabuli]MBB3084634.1 amino acid transporter [Geodermatophilus sabuli]SNX97172.1 Amino acid transporter [Geodermatophilus sabuli]
MTASRDTRPAQAETGLAKNRLGTSHVAFFVVAAAGPLLLMAGVAPIGIAFGGIATPLGFLIAGMVFALFAVGYVAMSRHVHNAGAFYAFVREGISRPLGVGSGLTVLTAYNLIAAGQVAATGFFAQQALLAIADVDVPWWVFAIIVWLLIGWLGSRTITLSAQVLGFFLSLEVIILLILAVPVLLQGGASGISVGSFNPANLTGGTGAMLVFAFGAFLGCEATVVYSEEAREPRRTIPRATYAAVAFLGLFYAFICWTIVIAYGEQSVVEAATNDPVNLVFSAMESYVGTPAADMMLVLLCTGTFASTLGFHNEAVRYFFALGREGVLPRALRHVHPGSGSPRTAVAAQSAFSALFVILLGALGADPYLQIFIPLAGAGVVGIIAMQAFASASVVGFFRRNPDLEATSWARAIAPGISTVCLTAAVVLMVTRFELLTGVPWPNWVNFALLLPLLAILIGGTVWARLGWRAEVEK